MPARVHVMLLAMVQAAHWRRASLPGLSWQARCVWAHPAWHPPRLTMPPALPVPPVLPPAPQGMESYCVRAFAEGLEIIPYTLAENAGLNPIEIVTELRNHHANGRRHHGGPAGLGLDAGCAGSYGQQHMMCL